MPQLTDAAVQRERSPLIVDPRARLVARFYRGSIVAKLAPDIATKYNMQGPQAILSIRYLRKTPWFFQTASRSLSGPHLERNKVWVSNQFAWGQKGASVMHLNCAWRGGINIEQNSNPPPNPEVKSGCRTPSSDPLLSKTSVSPLNFTTGGSAACRSELAPSAILFLSTPEQVSKRNCFSFFPKSGQCCASLCPVGCAQCWQRHVDQRIESNPEPITNPFFNLNLASRRPAHARQLTSRAAVGFDRHPGSSTSRHHSYVCSMYSIIYLNDSWIMCEFTYNSFNTLILLLHDPESWRMNIRGLQRRFHNNVNSQRE